MEVAVNYEIQFDELQMQAIDMASDIKRRLVSVSGPAGAGKTIIIRKIHEHFVSLGIPVALAAPTGKAARRIKEATGIDAVTIHKLLEYNRPGERDEETGKALDTTKPKRDRVTPLFEKVIIVDEYAMVNHELHNNLLAALPSGGCLRAFGDISQLPPIEEYSVKQNNGQPELTPFQKLVARPDSVVLEKVYRQGEGSAILSAANKVRKGHQPPIGDGEEFFLKLTDRPLDILKLHVQKSLENGVNYRDIHNQIITPQKNSWTGTQKLNQMLKNILNPKPEQSIELKRNSWDKDTCIVGIGDKIVCTSNTYDLRPYFERFEEWTEDQIPIMSSWIPCPVTKQMLNGETGIVTHIYPDGGLDIDFGDRIVELPYVYQEYWSQRDTVIDVYPSKNIDLAYALTTHKCQGSEFEQVCYVLNKSMSFIQSRQNFYTAITRARKRVMVICDQQSLRVSVFKVAR